MKFSSEKEMTDVFIKFLKKNILTDNIDYFEQVKGLFGIPDFVLVEKNQNEIINIFSIELKLNNWKRALQQAFKYKNFSNQSYVIIDDYYYKEIIKHLDTFIKFNIGLASFNNSEVMKIYYQPKPEDPFSKHYLNNFIKATSLDDKKYSINQFSELPELINNFAFAV